MALKDVKEEPWHATPIETVFKILDSQKSGLEEKEAKRRLKEFGLNIWHFRSSNTIFRILCRQLHNPIVYVLLAATVLANLLSRVEDSLVILVVVLLNTAIGFFQEYRAHETIKALKSMTPQKTTILRNNEPKIVSVSEITLGDIVVLRAGDPIPADLRLFSTKNLECEESALTGESLPVVKEEEPSSLTDPLSDRKSMAFTGTYVTQGSGYGIVVAIAFKTELGKISKMLKEITSLETPLTLSVKRMTKWITLAILFISISLFGIGYFRGSGLFQAAFAAIALAVAAIPEGLPAIMTIAFSVGMRRMAERKAIVRQLTAVETLGSTTIICTDKTGTLTCNEMTVQKIWTRKGLSLLSGIGYSLKGELSSPENKDEIKQLLEASILCSDATISTAEGISFFGSSTEIALLIAGRKIGLTEAKLREEWPKKDVIPFTHEQKFMATIHLSPSKETYVFIKGAPEVILSMCEKDFEEAKCLSYMESMARDGMRLLAVAKKRGGTFTKEGYTLLGLFGIADPPRKEVYQSLKNCYDAGVIVKMVTGDHPFTAEAIARDLGILKEGASPLTGQELQNLTEEAFKEAALKTKVFARVTPEDKLRLVSTLQEIGHVVAMTGDGVNDAPALKKADIGVAMGIRGTAVAKEASQIVLADDNFASIEAAIEEGRRVYDNLVKSLAFIFATGFSQAFVVLFAMLFFPIKEGLILYPLSPVQILWVNLVVAIGLAIPLVFEGPEPDIMKRPPRPKKAPLLSPFLLIKTLLIAVIMALGTVALFLWEYNTEIQKGILEELALKEAQTVAVTALVLFQIVYLFNCRSLKKGVMKVHFFSNPSIFIGVLISLLAQGLFIYTPFLQQIFGSSNLNFTAWLLPICVAVLLFPILFLERLFKK
ncbi:MAG: HAD-IC family P-type ATPase [Verrucomicrobia bacterium]|nr:HAD-IC family P-type ATPase [Verrucomicrobiota bacterium]